MGDLYKALQDVLHVQRPCCPSTSRQDSALKDLVVIFQCHMQAGPEEKLQVPVLLGKQVQEACLPQRAAKGMHKQGCAKPRIGPPTPTLNMGGRDAALLQLRGRQMVG